MNEVSSRSMRHQPVIVSPFRKLSSKNDEQLDRSDKLYSRTGFELK